MHGVAGNGKYGSSVSEIRRMGLFDISRKEVRRIEQDMSVLRHSLPKCSAEQLRRDPVHQDLGADADDDAGDDTGHDQHGHVMDQLQS